MNHTNKGITSRIIKRILFIFFVLFLCVVIYVAVGVHAFQKIEVNFYEITAPVSSSIRIVQITDLHNTEFGIENETLCDTIQNQNPDLIFITGDMFNRDDPNTDIICTLIQKLEKIAPVYYGYGNHEVSWETLHNQSLYDLLTSAGAIVLQDYFVDITVNNTQLRIGGCMNYYRKWGMMDSPEECDIEETFANDFENTDHYKILLNHIPTSFIDWKGADQYPVDLVFSGHYHGGMVRIPYIERGLYAPYVGLFPTHTKEVYYGEISTCVLSAGLGTEHYIPRMFNAPEVVVVDLIQN